MPRQYRRKPVALEAMQFVDNASAAEIVEWADGHVLALEYPPGTGSVNGLRVATMEGPLNAVPGTWIIRGVKGEFYPCDPEVFEEIYEEVEP